jgi:hypothetical protein
MAFDPATALLQVGSQLIERLWPNPEEANKAKLRLFEMQQAGELQALTGRMEIIRAEAASSNWLAASWRPITMLVFVALIVARWFGFAAPELGQEEYIKLWSIVELGLGGYVLGRSVEKIVPSIADAIKNR